jgi:hypothetical protein
MALYLGTIGQEELPAELNTSLTATIELERQHDGFVHKLCV